MAFDFDKLIQKGTKMADAVKSTAVDLAEKGKKQVDLVSEQAKLCPQCGAEVEENALFCNHCGAQL